MVRHVILAAAAALLLLDVPIADAGNLGKVGKSISRKQGGSSGKSSGGSSRPRESTRDRRTTADYDDGYHSGRSYYYGGYSSCAGCEPTSIQRRVFKPELFFQATYENVADSDGSLNLDTRLSAGPFGFGFNVSSYFEGTAGTMEAVRMTMWEGNIGARTLHINDRTEMWLTLGVSGLHSNQFDNVIGGGIGAELRHHMTKGLSIDGRARGMMFPDDLNATELRAGVTASVLHVGYRYLRFNVGPALQGPELGVSLRF
jgi:hypothetical protein